MPKVLDDAEEIVKDLKKKTDFAKRYGKDAKSVICNYYENGSKTQRRN